jgi:hypothetical protein
MSASVDMTMFIAPKSDQLNTDDLIGGPRTITVTKVSANQGSPEQPVSIWFEGDDGKPYKPCKSMRRVLVHVWGSDARSYVGRSMTLYCDPSVQFGGMKVGGIRISHMSDIDKEQTMALTATRAKRAPFTVHPLKAELPALSLSDYESCRDLPALDALEKRRAEVWKRMPPGPDKEALKVASDAAKARLAAAPAATGAKTKYDTASAIAALRVCKDEPARAAIWKDIAAYYADAMLDLPVDVEAVNNEVKEALAQL